MRTIEEEAERLIEAIEGVVQAVVRDNVYEGGLLTRNTIRSVDELRLVASAFKRSLKPSDAPETNPVRL
jgi:hypothetical protein